MFSLLIEKKYSYGWCHFFPLFLVLNLDVRTETLAAILQHEMMSRDMKSPHLKDGGDENGKSVAP